MLDVFWQRRGGSVGAHESSQDTLGLGTIHTDTTGPEVFFDIQTFLNSQSLIQKDRKVFLALLTGKHSLTLNVSSFARKFL
jgi:hypothetical protein